MVRTRTAIAAVTLLGLVACRPAESRRAIAEPAPAETATTTTATASPSGAPMPAQAGPVQTVESAPPSPPPPARVEHLLVPGDRVASIVRSSDGAPPLTVFLPGVCSNGGAYLHTFPEAARKQGGVVAIEGDQPCGGSTEFRTFSWDAARQHARVEAALAAAGLTEVPREGITIVGYSQGAALAEQMVQRWPGRYARIVLIGAPSNPSPKNLARARALATMSCDRDVPARMKQAAQAATRAGVPATYFEMPGCTHGNVTEGERIFDEAFGWLRANERALDPQATAVKIAGSPPS